MKESLKWTGKCENCNNWNTMIEKQATSKSKIENRRNWIHGDEQKKVNASIQADDESETHEILTLPNAELTRVFGRGLVMGSVILLSGAPGSGKS